MISHKLRNFESQSTVNDVDHQKCTHYEPPPGLPRSSDERDEGVWVERVAAGRFQISAAQLNRRFGEVQAQVEEAPVVVTHHGRPRMVLLSAAAYEAAVAAEGTGENPAALRRKLDVLLDAIQEGYISVDRDRVVRTVNRVAESYLGRARDQLVGKPWSDVFVMASDQLEGFVRRALEGGEVVRTEMDSALHPGQRLSVTAFPLPLPAGGASILFTNVTEQMRLETSLARSSARLNALLDALTDKVAFTLDRDATITSWSAGARLALGFGADIVGRSLETIISQDDATRAAMWSSIATASRDGECPLTLTIGGRDGPTDANGRVLRLDGASDEFLADLTVAERI